MKLGYLAIDERTGERLALTGAEHPRKQLLAKLGRKHADKMFCDTTSGDPKHIGYIVNGQWFRVYEVHDWQGKAE